MKVKKILISQPEPADLDKSPYKNLISKYGAELTFFKFFEVVGLTASEFRKSRIHLSEYTAVIFNSKWSVDHFFRLAKELRETIPETTKYFCSSEQIANYLQNYVQYRKRKIFYGSLFFSELIEIMQKHREEKFIFPCSDEKQTEYTKLLEKAKFKYTKATMYTSVPRDLSQFDIKSFDMICLFSPIGVRALLHNYPDAKEMNLPIAAFGTSTHAALKAAGIKMTIAAPTKMSPSMAAALENYINGKGQGEAVISSHNTAKKESTRGTRSSSSSSSSTAAPKKPKSVFANKAKYKQLQEERKAQAAARRAERKAEREAAERAKAEAEAKENKDHKD